MSLRNPVRVRLPACIFVLAALGSLPGTPCGAQPSRFEAPADLFYLHPLVNYSLHPLWQARWERERLARGGLRANVGSISTKDFASLAHVEITEPAGRRLRVRYTLDWTDSPHLDGPERQNWFGLEFGGFGTRIGVLGVELVVHPPSDKGDLDLVSSLVWTDATRTRYLRLGWRRDDYVYEEKSDVGAIVDRTAAGPTWVAHVERGHWALSSEGTLLARAERRFPDVERSPELAATRVRRGWSSTALRRVDARRMVEVRVEHRDFEQAELVPPTATGLVDRERSSRWNHAGLAWAENLGEHWRLRVQLHRMAYDHTIDGAFHRRRENLGGIFVERALGGGHWIDLSVMGTGYEWTTTPASALYGADQDGLATKVGLGWTLELGDAGWFRALISHEPDPQQFGGANVQAQMLF